MKKRKFLSFILVGAVLLTTASAPAYAAKGDVEGGGTDAPIYSSTTVSVPDGLKDGMYVGNAKVDPDDDEEFNFYPISVAVKVTGGAIESFLVSGASTSDVQYSKRAEEGINEQLAGKGAGDVDVDAIATATCSSYAIVQALNAALKSEPTSTFFLLGEEGTGKAIYNPSGTSFDLTVIDPAEGKDYDDIEITYAVGKFANTLTENEGYTIEKVKSENESELVYRVTILPVAFEIPDGEITHKEIYNSLGRTLDVTVAGSSAGRITILSGAAVELNKNTLKLTGGNGETLADFISGIGSITMGYTDKNGDGVLKSYTTQWQHDVEPEFTGEDFFNKDGTVNFSIVPFANGASGSYTMSIDSSGFTTVIATVGNAKSIEGAAVSGVKNVYATGKKIVPDITVKLGAATLTKDDYDVTVTKNTLPGTATVKITGKGAYTGTITKTFKIYAQKGSAHTVGNYKYKVTNADISGKGTVMVTGFAKTKTSINIGKTVKIGTVSYKITAIGENAFQDKTKVTDIAIGANVKTIGKRAFYNCKNVKTVKISTKNLTSKTVKSQAFKKLGASNYKKVTVKVPSAKLKAYKKLLIKAGLSSKAKVK